MEIRKAGIIAVQSAAGTRFYPVFKEALRAEIEGLG
tara:strand:+ start:375 stop:482 length:108 start_codon:yes stop_codon:yes gene_type:complete